MSRFPLAAALLAAAVAFTPAQPGAKRQGMKEAAEDIAAAVKEAAAAHNQTAVRLSDFAPVGFNGEDAGAAIRHDLRAALGNLVNPTATLELAGKYSHAPAEGQDGKAIVVAATLTDTATKKVVKELSVPILFVRDVTRFTGPTGAIAPRGLATVARTALDGLVTKPTAVVADGRVSANAKSDFAVEVLARAADGTTQPRPAKLEGGVPFVELAAADVLEIRIRNRSPDEAVGRVAIDGLDLFAFDPKGLGHVALPSAKDGKSGEATVRGWPTAENGKPADITPGGYATLADKPRGKVGMIGVAVSRAATTDEPPTEFVTIRFRRPAK
jgi:hypothetical protein